MHRARLVQGRFRMAKFGFGFVWGAGCGIILGGSFGFEVGLGDVVLSLWQMMYNVCVWVSALDTMSFISCRMRSSCSMAASWFLRLISKPPSQMGDRMRYNILRQCLS